MTNTTAKNLCQLTANDIMSSPVLTAQDSWSVKMLLDFFSKHHITGVPVTNYSGQLKGVVTMTDVLHFENLPTLEKERLIGVSCYGEYAGYEFSANDLQQLAQHADINCPVAQIMTPHIISVEMTTPVTAVARLLREREIHRAFVLSEQKLVGVISTSNLLDALITSCACENTD